MIALALTRTLAVYGLVCWVYVAIISIVQPSWLGLQLTHFASFPHVDTFGEASFAVSIACYFCYRLLLERTGAGRRGGQRSSDL